MKQIGKDDNQWNFLTNEQLERYAAADKKSRSAGLVVTLVFHIILLAILLFFSLKSLKKGELSVYTDADSEIAREIEQEQQRQLEEIKDLAQNQLREEFLSSASYKSIAVNMNGQEQSPAEESGRTSNSEPSVEPETSPSNISEGIEVSSAEETQSAEKEGAGEYRGPSVLSWTLDGRRALYLPIPAYKCAGEGIVYVQIVVGKNGYVKKATVISAPSASDECLRSCALDAARVSRFSRSDIASDNQLGEIVYKFIAQ